MELDALATLLKDVGLAMTPPVGCPSLGSGSPPFGDVNCDGLVNAGDTIAILQYKAGVPVNPPPQSGCTPLGQPLPA